MTDEQHGDKPQAHLSPMALLAALPGSGIRQLRPGVWFSGDPEAARVLLAKHDELTRRMREADTEDGA